MDTQEVALSKIDEEDYTFVHADDETTAIDFCRAPMPKKKRIISTHNHDSLCAIPPSVPAFDGVDASSHEEEDVDERNEEDHSYLKGRVRFYGAGVVSGVVGCLLGGPVIGIAAGLGLAYATSQNTPVGDVARVMGNATERFVEGVQQQVEEQHATAQSIQETWHGISHISWTQQGRLAAHRAKHLLIRASERYQEWKSGRRH
mmetsp:Transcript_8738/g.15857  ORF Transcript_8738/g.15857 Transcript_8738/m.15857 type:complete len:203 (-) Transcript_8738:735-1343(-)